MTATLLLILSAFLLYCFSDIKYRSTPAVEIFFLGAIAIAIGGGDFAKISVVVLAVCFGLFSSVPRQIGYCLMFFPVAWPVLMFGHGVRGEIVGRGDLYFIGILSALFTWDVVIASLFAMFLWGKYWRGYQVTRSIPLIPGMVVGAVIALFIRGMTGHSIGI